MSYVQIQQREMDQFLRARGFQPMEIEGTHEYVYGKRVDKDGRPLSLRVYTSISENTNVAREKGSDAIRLELFARHNGNVLHVGHSRHVKRIATWRKNLAGRITQWQDMTGPDCPNCNAPMVLRKGKYGKFWGCSNYKHTGCRCSKKLNEA